MRYALTALAHERIKRALESGVRECEWHRTQFGRLGYENNGTDEPRCASCKQPWRTMVALEALASAELTL